MTALFFKRESSPRSVIQVQALAGQEGAVYVILAVVLLGVIAIGGLALDSSNLYWTQLQCQKAADAAALAGMKYRLQVGGTAASGATDGVPTVQEKARRVALASLAKSGLTTDDPAIVSVPVTYFPVGVIPAGLHVADSVEVTVNYNKDLFLMSWLPVIGSTRRAVSATAKASLSGAQVVLLLDLSGSMGCPSSGACGCMNTSPGCPDPNDPTNPICLNLTTCPPANDPNNPAKFGRLKTATLSFIDNFDLTRDHVALIPFAARAKVVVPFKSTGFYLDTVGSQVGIRQAVQNGFDMDPSDAGSLGIGEGANSNFSDAMITAYQHVLESTSGATPVIDPNKLVNYVFFSDSSPSAARVFFSDPDGISVSPGPASLQAIAADPNQYRYDYTFWELLWSDPEGEDPDRFYSGPSGPVPTSQVLASVTNPRGSSAGLFLWTHDNGYGGPPDQLTERWPSAVRDNCTSGFNDVRLQTGGRHDALSNDEFAKPTIESFKDCVDSMGFRGYPGTTNHFSSVPIGFNYTSRNSGTHRRNYVVPTIGTRNKFNLYGQYRRIFTDAAIVWADGLRKLNRHSVGPRSVGGGTFWVVGIGKPAAVNMQMPDVYQFCPLCNNAATVLCPNCVNEQDYCLFCSEEEANADSGLDLDGHGVPNGITRRAACDNWFANPILKDGNPGGAQYGVCPQQTAFGDRMQSSRRKDLVLARIAASRTARDDAWRSYNGGALPFPMPDYSDLGNQLDSWNQVGAYLDANNTELEGHVLLSNSYNDLDNFFQQISSSILLKLIQ